MRGFKLVDVGAWTAIRIVVLAVGAAFALTGSASAYNAAVGYSAGDYATGFPFASCCGWGPVGVAFDASDNLYVSNFANGHLYRFQPGGGAAGPSTRLTKNPLLGGIKGLAFTRTGHLYIARAIRGDVVEVDVRNGHVNRTVATGFRCPTALAADPLSDDLFVSQSTCKGEIARISNFASGPGNVSTYARTGCCADGLAFAPDGTLYAASGGHVLKIDGTGSSTPGATRSIASVSGADGVAVGAPDPGDAPFLVVNRTNGRVTRLDFSQTPPAQSAILSGGSRGDFVAVDSRGCLYVTQTDSIVRIGTPGPGCQFSPSTPGAGDGPPVKPGIVIDTISGGAGPAVKGGKCVARRRLVVRVRQRGRVRLRVVRVYVNGRYRKKLRHRRVSAPIVIRHVPRGMVRVKLVARTKHGRKLTARKRFKNCTRSRTAHA